MSDQATITAQTHVPAPPVPPSRPVSPQEDALRNEAITALLNAVTHTAQVAAAAPAAQDAQDMARAALQLAQAAVILDPNLVSPAGVPPNALHPPLPHIQMQKAPPPPPAASGPSSGSGGGQPS